MKLHCILITLTFVNVSQIIAMNYATSVFITYEHIKLAFAHNPDGLADAIKDIVFGNESMANVSLMLAIPDLAYNLNISEDIGISKQEIVQKKISQFAKIRVPHVNSVDFKMDSMSQLGLDLRSITEKVTLQLLSEEMNRGGSAFVNYMEVCRLAGLFRSIKYPNSFINDIKDDACGNCTLTSGQGYTYVYKRDYGNIILETNDTNINEFQSLEDQIKFWQEEIRKRENL